MMQNDYPLGMDPSDRLDRAPSSADPLLITADDGTLFSVWVERAGRHRSLPRWVAHATTGVLYEAPPYAGEDTPEEIRALIAAWWSWVPGAVPSCAPSHERRPAAHSRRR